MSLSNLFFQRYVEKGASVVHFGSGDQSLKELIQPTEYVGVDIMDGCDVKCDLNVEFPDFGDKKFDIALVAGVVEYLDNPAEFLSKVRYIANTTIILEYKYDYCENFKEEWKKAWIKTGCEWELSWLWDHVNNLYFFDELDEQYSPQLAVHTCQKATHPNFIIERLPNGGVE
jgi:hypothetical protein